LGAESLHPRGERRWEKEEKEEEKRGPPIAVSSIILTGGSQMKGCRI